MVANRTCIDILPTLRLLLACSILAGAALRWGVAQQIPPVEPLRPIVSRSEQRKICVHLCQEGLGGRSCGEDCVDLIPTDLPVCNSTPVNASSSGVVNETLHTRSDACDVLCDNGLGRPLCQCKNDLPNDGSRQPSFIEICSFYCIKYNYRINGCQSCSTYAAAASSEFSQQSLPLADRDPKVNWTAWCIKKCRKGDGGAACDCDLLPMGLFL